MVAKLLNNLLRNSKCCQLPVFRFFVLLRVSLLVKLIKLLGRVVRKPINGLRVNRGINFSCLKMFFTAYVFYSLNQAQN